MPLRTAACLTLLATPACAEGLDASPPSFRCFAAGGAGLVGLEEADISGNPTITGPFADVFSNIIVRLAGSYDLGGNALSGGTVELAGSTRPRGVIVEDAGTIVARVPTTEVEWARTHNDNAKIPCVQQGNKCRSPVSSRVLTLAGQAALRLPAGTYSLASIRMSGTTRLDVAGQVTIYLDDGATFNGGSAANPANDSLSLVSSGEGEIKVNGGGTTSMHIYAPLADVRFAGAQGFRGSALGRTLHISGTATLEVTKNLAQTNDRTDCIPAPEDERPDTPLPDLAR